MRRLDLHSDLSEGGRLRSNEHLTSGKVADSNAAGRLFVAATELAARRNVEAVRLSWSGMRV